MAESELAGKITKLVKAADKLIQDVKKDVDNVMDQVNQLKGNLENKEKKEPDGNQH